ncbi:MAG: CTP synthase, partial [Chlamydiia bacterium]|nr:CTP synthase [Chlamydiia bacterium]
ADVVLVEIGGTVGDIESLPFLEAIRQFRYERPKDCLNIHMTYVPYLKAAGEVKTKPTQHSVQTLRSIGILPDMILCRCESPLSMEIKKKISLFCNVPHESVFEAIDVETSIYEVPLLLEKQGVGSQLCHSLGLEERTVNLSDWEQLIETIKHPKGVITVGVVGKYLQHKDAYKSVFEALQHGAIFSGYRLNIKTIESDKETLKQEIVGCDGLLVPGGFGERGWEGKINAAQFCREQKVPYFGICLGMQVMVVEFARNVLRLKGANSTEMEPQTADPVISLLSEQEEIQGLGGTMRLGAYSCLLQEGSKVHQAYGALRISERHRHRYEFNNRYKELAEKHGLVLSGILEHGHLCEVAE